MKRLSKTEKFTDLFDNNWNQNRSTIRNKLQNERSYDPTYSWEARCDNPQSFTRLQATEMPIQASNPITLSGAAVVQLERQGDGLEVFNCPLPKSTGSFPLSLEQREMGMTSDLSGKIPILEEAQSKNKYIVVDQMPSFRNMKLQPTVFREADFPKALIAAGPQCDKKLLSVRELREISEFEKRKHAADEFLKSAINYREKTRKLLAGQQYHRGVLMLDSNRNEDSEVYGDRARNNLSQQQLAEARRIERLAQLGNKGSSIVCNGNILVPDSLNLAVKVNPDFRVKAGNNHNFTFEETFDRLFNRQLLSSNLPRTQRLRDLELGNKKFNIVNHTPIEHWPGNKIDRLENKIMAHPSQNSLESHRSLQGTLRPY